MRNSRNIIFLILLAVGILFGIRPASADTCTLEEQESIKRELADVLKQSFSDFKQKANYYNQLAQSYVSTCENMQGNIPPPIEPSKDDMVAAKVAGVDDVLNTDIYKYSGLPWGQMQGSNDSCEQMRRKAAEAFQTYLDAYNSMRESIQDTKMPVASQCICDGKGQNYMCASVVDPVGGGSVDEKGQNGHCESFTALQARLNACPLCGIFEAVLNTSAKIAHVAWESTAGPLSEVVIIFGLVLLALESLRAVASVGGFKVSAYMKSVLTILFKIALTVFLLSSSQYIYTLFISPVVKGGLDMGLTIAAVGGNITAEDTATVGSIVSQELDDELFNQVISTVKSFGSAVSTLPACGAGLICHSATSGVFNLPNFYMFLSGLIMLAFGVMIWLSLSFYLIDCTVQLGMVCALVPLFIACWPFKLTQSYTVKGVKMLMNTFFNYTMMGAILLLGTEIITFAVSGEGKFSMQELITAINNSDMDKLKVLSSLDGIRVLMLLACSIFAMKLIAKVDSLATLFSKGAGADTASKMGGSAMAVAQNLGLGALQAGGSALTKTGDSMLEKMGIKVKMGQLKDKAVEAHQDILGALGRPVFGKFQNQQTGSGLSPEGSEGGSGLESNRSEDNGRNNLPPPVERNENGSVTLPNGDEVNGFGEATRNDDGGVTFTSVGADGSRNIDSYDKDGNRHVQTFNGSGEMTSNYSQNKDGSSSGFITKDDGTVQRWDEPAGTFKNVGAVQERNEGGTENRSESSNTPSSTEAAENGNTPPAEAAAETITPQSRTRAESPQTENAGENAAPQTPGGEQILPNNNSETTNPQSPQPKGNQPKPAATRGQNSGQSNGRQLRNDNPEQPEGGQTRPITPTRQATEDAQQPQNPQGKKPAETKNNTQQPQNPQETSAQPKSAGASQQQAPQGTTAKQATANAQQPQTPQGTPAQPTSANAQQPQNPQGTPAQPTSATAGAGQPQTPQETPGQPAPANAPKSQTPTTPQGDDKSGSKR